MIDIKDLQIGDWVRIMDDALERQYLNDYKPGQIIQVTEILDRGINPDWMGGEVNDLLHFDIIEPIPLTPEILKDNGWKDISDHTLKGCDTFRLRLEQGPFDYTLTLKLRDYFRFDSYDDRVYTLCGVYFGFKYVHELQHALRLCGIDKTIEL